MGLQVAVPSGSLLQLQCCHQVHGQARTKVGEESTLAPVICRRSHQQHVGCRQVTMHQAMTRMVKILQPPCNLQHRGQDVALQVGQDDAPGMGGDRLSLHSQNRPAGGQAAVGERSPGPTQRRTAGRPACPSLTWSIHANIHALLPLLRLDRIEGDHPREAVWRRRAMSWHS